ncbi:hypothetical protein TWF718_009265 [Orbilia javanica]|uniref:Uncharacterized protein n=1 Tax=Orbilia javanica TaxID=47235 RepID=A0AAN8RBN2_9PEZI
MSTSTPTYILDEDGNTLASCIPKKTKRLYRRSEILGYFKVSSKALSLAGSSFPKPSKVSGSDNQGCSKAITIEVESMDSALIVMRMIHFQNSQNPKTITLETLSEIAGFCYRYGCQEAIQPSVELWTKSLWSEVTEETIENLNDDECVEWLTIGKVFKIPKVLQIFAKKVVFEIFSMGSDNFETAMFDFEGEVCESFAKDRIKEALEEKLFAIKSSFSNNDGMLRSSRCRISGIAVIYNIKLQLEYPEGDVDHIALSRICNNLKKTCKIAQEIEKCPHNNGSREEAFCRLSEDMLDVLSEIEKSDVSKPLLEGAGISSDTPGSVIELEDIPSAASQSTPS